MEDVASDTSDIEALITAPPGSATFSKFKFFDNEGRTRRWEVAFLIREESKRIRHLGNPVRVEVRAALMRENGVGLIPILIEVGSYRRNVFETWLNFHAPNHDGRRNDHLETLCKQDWIPILFYGGAGRERSIEITNSRLKPTWSAILAQVSNMNAWGMREFDLARDLFTRRCPTVRSLWNSLNLQNEDDAKLPGTVWTLSGC
jgi:hypothetical protein